MSSFAPMGAQGPRGPLNERVTRQPRSYDQVVAAVASARLARQTVEAPVELEQASVALTPTEELGTELEARYEALSQLY